MLLAVELTQGIEEAWADVAAFVPKLAAAVAVLVIGWLIARAIRRIVATALGRVGFDAMVDRSGLGEPLAKAGYDNANRLMATVVFSGVMLIVLQMAVGVFGDSAVQSAFDGMIAFIPRLFVALIIVVLTGVVANAVATLVRPAVHHLDFDGRIVQVATVAVWVIGGFGALDQLDVAPVVVDTLFQVLVASLGLIIVIKFGVGGIWAARDRFWPRVYDAIGSAEERPAVRRDDADLIGVTDRRP
ncbi:MAG: hypothetical protein AAGD18_04700 [Actinomycetota bacterium]